MRSSRLVVLGVSAAALLGGQTAVAPGTAAAACGAPAPLTVEEQRLTRGIGGGEPVAAQILRRSGFAGSAGAFAAALCAATSVPAATAVVSTHGGDLWTRAVQRAQAPPAGGDALPPNDDRPLYWARLTLATALREWAPAFPVSPAERATLQQRLEYASRGLDSSAFPATTGRRLFVTGFDPFLLDDEIRRGNPSGAAALTLDGRTLRVGAVRIRVQAVVLPVRYADFDGGIAAAAIGPHVGAGAQRADAITTVSQGRPGQFDLEVWNGRRRSTSLGDNNNVAGGGTFTAPLVFPGVGAGAEFIQSTLPLPAMSGLTGQPFPIVVNTAVTEIPAGATFPMFRPNGPTAGSIAVEGGGGGYLSNEVAYRNTLLLASTAGAPRGGHVHTPVLNLGAGNPDQITDPAFEQSRTSIVAEVQAIVARAV